MTCNKNYYTYVLMLFIIALIIFTPIFRGLYFEREWYMVHLVSLSLFLIWCCLRIIRKEASFLQNPLDYAALALVLCYLLSLYGAVYPRAAIGEFLKVVNFFVIYLFVRDVVQKAASPKTYIILILNTFLVAGTLVAIIGLAGASGALQIPGLFDGTRIHSTLQYHNANAVYLCAMFLLALGLITQVQRWYFRLPYLPLAFLFLISIVFTFSRGAWLVLAVVSLIYLISTMPGYRLKSTIYLLLVTIVTILAFPTLEHLTYEQASAQFFRILLLLSFAVAGLGALIELLMRSKAARPKTQTVYLILLTTVPFILLTFYINNASATSSIYHPLASPPAQNEPVSPAIAQNGFLPQQIQGRLSEIDFETKSAKDRFIYFQSALKIARDYPLTGAGGGAWEALYLSYLQGYYPEMEYTVETHSYYLKVLIESGVLGLLAIMALCYFFIAGFIRYRFSSKVSPEQKQLFLIIFAPAVAIGAHSAIDFGLSLGAISIFLWILLAMGSSMLFPGEGSSVTAAQRMSIPITRPQLLNIACMLVTIFLIVFTSNLYSGYRHAALAHTNLQMENSAAAIHHLEQAIAKDSYRAANYLDLATLHKQSLHNMKISDIDPAYLRAKTLNLAAHGANLEPFNHVIAARHGDILLTLGETEKALEVLAKLPKLHPYSIEIYEYLASTYLKVAKDKLTQENVEDVSVYIDKLKELKETMLQKLGNSEPLQYYLTEAKQLKK